MPTIVEISATIPDMDAKSVKALIDEAIRQEDMAAINQLGQALIIKYAARIKIGIIDVDTGENIIPQHLQEIGMPRSSKDSLV